LKKDRQYNVNKKTNNDLQNTTQKTKDQATRQEGIGWHTIKRFNHALIYKPVQNQDLDF
jgi:hypothetical protein